MEGASKAANCEICAASFNMLRRSHKCKRCKRAVCANCSKGKRAIVGYEDSKQHRSCDSCELDIQFHSKLRQTNNLAWNYLSDIGKQWLDNIPNLQKMKDDTSYESLLKEAEQLGQADENFQELESDLSKGATEQASFNYSLHEFLFFIQENYRAQKCRDNVKNVLRAHCMRNPSMGYTSGLNHIAAFILCFMDEENAFWLLTHLVENLLPPHLFSKVEKEIIFYGYYAENFVIKSILKEKFNLKKTEEIYTVDSFVDIALPLLLLPLLVDTLNASSLYVLWDEMIRAGNFFVFERTLLAILLKHKDLVLDQNMLAGRRYQDIFCKDISYEFIQTKSKLVEVKEAQILKLRKDYELQFERDWEKRSLKPRKTITEAKKFAKAEIELLHQGYRALVKSRGGKKTSVSRDEWKTLLTKVAPTDKSAIELGPMRVFEMFDLDRDGIIEQSDFVAASILLTTGKFEDRMIICFKFNDASEKNYLTPEEYNNFVETVVRACLVVMRNETDPSVLRKVAGFKKSMGSVAKSNTKIKYVDVQEKVMKDELVLDLSRELEGRRRMSTVVIGASRLKLKQEKNKPEEEGDSQEPEFEDRRRSTAITGASKMGLLKKSPETKQESEDSLDDGSRFEERKRSTVIMGGLQLKSGEKPLDDHRKRSTAILDASQLGLAQKSQNTIDRDNTQSTEPIPSFEERRRSSAIMGKTHLYQTKQDTKEDLNSMIDDRRRSKAVFSSSRIRSFAQIDDEIKEQTAAIGSKTSLDDQGDNASKTEKLSESISVSLEPEINDASYIQIMRLQAIGVSLSGFLTAHTSVNTQLCVEHENKPKLESSCLAMEFETDDGIFRQKEVLNGMEARNSKLVAAHEPELVVQSDILLVQPVKSLSNAMEPEQAVPQSLPYTNSNFLVSTSQAIEPQLITEPSHTTQKPNICFDSSAPVLLSDITEEADQYSQLLRALEQRKSLAVSCQSTSEITSINTHDVKHTNVAENLSEETLEKEFLKEEIIRKLQQNYSSALEGHSNEVLNSLGEQKVLRENMAQKLELIQDEQLPSISETSEKARTLFYLVSHPSACLDPQHPASTISSCNVPITGEFLLPEIGVEDENVQDDYQRLSALAHKISLLLRIPELSDEKQPMSVEFPYDLFSLPSIHANPEEQDAFISEAEKTRHLLKTLDQKTSDSLGNHSLPNESLANAHEVKMMNIAQNLTDEDPEHSSLKEDTLRKLSQNYSKALEFQTGSSLNIAGEQKVLRQNVSQTLEPIQDEQMPVSVKTFKALFNLQNQLSAYLSSHNSASIISLSNIPIPGEFLFPEIAVEEESTKDHYHLHYQRLLALAQKTSLSLNFFENNERQPETIKFPFEIFSSPSIHANPEEENVFILESEKMRHSLEMLEQKVSKSLIGHSLPNLKDVNVHNVKMTNIAENLTSDVLEHEFLNEQTVRGLPERYSKALELHSEGTLNARGEQKVLRENTASDLPQDDQSYQLLRSSDISGILANLMNRKSAVLDPHRLAERVSTCAVMLFRDSLTPEFPEIEERINYGEFSHNHHQVLVALQQKISPIYGHHLASGTTTLNIHEIKRKNFAEGLDGDTTTYGFLKEEFVRSLGEKHSKSLEAHSATTINDVGGHKVLRENVSHALERIKSDQTSRRIEINGSTYVEPQASSHIITPSIFELPGETLNPLFPENEEIFNHYHYSALLAALEGKISQLPGAVEQKQSDSECVEFPHEIFSHSIPTLNPEENTTADHSSLVLQQLVQKTSHWVLNHTLSEITAATLYDVQRRNFAEKLVLETPVLLFSNEEYLRKLPENCSRLLKSHPYSMSHNTNDQKVLRENIAEKLGDTSYEQILSESTVTTKSLMLEDKSNLGKNGCLSPQNSDNVVAPCIMQIFRNSLTPETPCQDESSIHDHHHAEQLAALEHKLSSTPAHIDTNERCSNEIVFPHDLFSDLAMPAKLNENDKTSNFPLGLENKTANSSEIHPVIDPTHNSTCTLQTQNFEEAFILQREPSFMPLEPVLVSANPKNEIEFDNLEENKLPDFTADENNLSEPINQDLLEKGAQKEESTHEIVSSLEFKRAEFEDTHTIDESTDPTTIISRTNFLPPMQGEDDDIVQKNYHEKYLDIEKQTSKAFSAPSYRGESVQPKEPVIVARTDFCEPLQSDEVDYSVTHDLIARYKAIEKTISRVLQSHVEDLVTKIHKLIERPVTLAGNQFDSKSIAGNQDRSSAESETSSMKVGYSLGSDNEGEEDGHADEGVKISIFGRHAKQKPQQHEVQSASDTKKTPNLSILSESYGSDLLRSTEDSRTSQNESLILDLSGRKAERNNLIDNTNVIEEEDPDTRSEDAQSRKASYVDLNSSQLIDDYHSLHKESFIRADSLIITNMKGAPKAQVQEIRTNNINKSSDGLSCKGCLIF